MRRGRRRRLPGDVLRRALGRAGRLPAARRPAERPRPLVLRHRRHQAGPPAQGPGAAADGDVRRAADRAAGRPAAVAHRRHRRRRRAAVAAGRRRVRTPGGARARLRRRSRRAPTTEPAPVSHCGQCRWSDALHAAVARAGRRPLLVAGMRGDHRARAASPRGIPTLEALAAATPERAAAARHRRPRATRLLQQARLQVRERDDRPAAVRAARPGAGPWAAAAARARARATSTSTSRATRGPTDGAGREYLAGLWDRGGRVHRRSGRTTPTRRDAADARPARRLTRRLRRRPGHARLPLRGLRETALKRLTGRHGTREAELDQLLRDERFVDLYAVVRQGAADQQGRRTRSRSSRSSTGATPAPPATRAWPTRCRSVVEYERWSWSTATTAILDDIRRYNRGRRPLDPRPARVAGAAAGRARAAARTLPRAAGARTARPARPVRRGGGRGRARRPAQGRRAPAARRPRRLAPARGAPGVVGLLPAQGPRRRGARRRRRGARRAVRADRRRRRQAVEAVALRVPAAGHQGQRGQAQAAGRRHPGGGRRGPRDGRRRRVAGAQGRPQPAGTDARAVWGRRSRRRSRCCGVDRARGGAGARRRVAARARPARAPGAAAGCRRCRGSSRSTRSSGSGSRSTARCSPSRARPASGKTTRARR